MDLYSELQQLNNNLVKSIKNLRKAGSDYAAAERDYKVALRQEALKLRASDMPVTLIQITVYGDEYVADLRLKRDVALATYEANKEHIMTTKLQMRLLENQIAREWGTAERMGD